MERRDTWGYSGQVQGGQVPYLVSCELAWPLVEKSSLRGVGWGGI